MKVIELLEKSLRENGFDGLVQEDNECACKIGELVPCESDFSNCRAGYLVPCSCGEGCDFHITAIRPTQLAPDAGNSAVSTSILQASALSTSQAESAPTQRG